MIRRPPRSTRTDTLFPYTTLFRSQVSMGDIILSGGEMGALLLLDACIRLLPGVMGAASSGDDESFENGLLESPHYTRPASWEGRRSEARRVGTECVSRCRSRRSPCR